MTASTPTPQRAAPLTLLDRCDTCGAQAFVRALFVSGELTFCGHHARLLSESLREQALLVEDGTAAVNVRPGPSANHEG